MMNDKFKWIMENSVYGTFKDRSDIMDYPESAINRLKEVGERLDREFHKVWGTISPSVERDTVMYHLFAAKKQLNEIIGGNEHDSK